METGIIIGMGVAVLVCLAAAVWQWRQNRRMRGDNAQLRMDYARGMDELRREHDARLHANVELHELQQRQQLLKDNNQSIVDNLKESHQTEVDALKEQWDAQRRQLLGQHEREKTEMKQQWDAQQRQLLSQWNETKVEMQRQWEEKMQTMRLAFDKLSAEHLRQQQADMKATNRESVENLLMPLRQTIETFKKEFSDKMTDTARTDAVMKEAIRHLSEKTELLDQSATRLTRALKADPKKQGDWGEEILRNILEASGMTEGIDFETQSRESDEEGNLYIPDVKVKIPGEGYLIVDSKTSIKAYLEYLEADNEAERKQKLREHIDSVRKHYRELAEKHYPKKVKDAAGYVLMFIPNEGSYLLAVENDPRLAIDAYREHIIIVNPTNLMLALQIVSLLWQNQKQTKNVRDIIDAATKLYEKFATFSESFNTIGERLQSLNRVYGEARSQLTDGPGNFARRLESFKEKGVLTNKTIHPKLLEESDTQQPTTD